MDGMAWLGATRRPGTDSKIGTDPQSPKTVSNQGEPSTRASSEHQEPLHGSEGRTLERHELSPETQVHPSPRSSSNPVISYMDLRTNPRATDGEP